MSILFNEGVSFTAKDLASKTGCEIIGDGDRIISGIATLKNSNINHIAFLNSKKYYDDFKNTKAGACFISEADKDFAPEGLVLLVSKNVHMSYALASQLFFPSYLKEKSPSISNKAHIEVSAKIGANSHIEPHVFIGKNVKIGDNAVIRAGAYIGDNVEIGNNSIIMSNVNIKYSIIGDNFVANEGCVIGSSGFGFAMGKKHENISQIGMVIIGNNVSLGANTCIDRGALDNTIIGDNVRMDNLVHIAHNVTIGAGTVIAAQSGVAGSTNIGNYVVIGGQCGISGHINVGDGSIVAAHSGVMTSVEPGSTIFGYPAEPLKLYMRMHAILRKMAKKDNK